MSQLIAQPFYTSVLFGDKDHEEVLICESLSVNEGVSLLETDAVFGGSANFSDHFAKKRMLLKLGT